MYHTNSEHREHCYIGPSNFHTIFSLLFVYSCLQMRGEFMASRCSCLQMRGDFMASSYQFIVLY